ncbi:MAG: DUF4494 domain-containing protein [Paludibacter sp.]|nr:DUF4494 domain-containing protein [Paludibacter sp.]MDD4197870.1 DUF4494 domain-containing protein [Paludibacter sp.]MDD4428140.1 DUF4494 domain-containing protein [Paludibacter sp.]
MHNWFECKVKLEKTAEEGKIIKVNESYLVDALTFTEAEERMIEEMKPFISGDFSVANIKRAKINEMFFHDDGDKWYRFKVNYITLDEEKGVEKKVPVAMMVQASEIGQALERLHEGMKGSMADYEVVTIAETLIMDVFKYGKPEEA